MLPPCYPPCRSSNSAQSMMLLYPMHLRVNSTPSVMDAPYGAFTELGTSLW